MEPTAKDGARVVAIRGAVLDILFPAGTLPAITDAVEIAAGDGPPFVAEVQAHLDSCTARAIALRPTTGLRRGKASLPPQERRGLVLIDPPYELAKEYRDVVRAIHQSHKRWATGIYAIWYPVVNRHDIEDMIEGLEALGIRKILQIELGVAPDTNERGMTASGMIVINPPWKLESQMKEILPFLQDAIAPATGHWKVDWIVPE